MRLDVEQPVGHYIYRGHSRHHLQAYYCLLLVVVGEVQPAAYRRSDEGVPVPELAVGVEQIVVRR